MSRMSDFVEGFFFREDDRLYWRASHFGLTERPFEVRTQAGNVIYGTVVQPERHKKGECAPVLYFHSGQFNYTYNLLQVAFLTEKGHTVVLFDYSGCGHSTGKASFSTFEDDTEAIFKLLSESPGKDKAQNKFILFGQGIGADAALHFYERHPDWVCGMILEDVYSSRKNWAKGHFGPVVGHAAAAFLEKEDRSNGEILPTLQVPTLVVYPEKSTFTFKGERKRVEALLPKSAKVWTAPRARYLNVFARPSAEARNLVYDFLKKKCRED